jgi:hypothetical protein
MKSPEPCRECQIIAEELATAYAQVWDTADPAMRRAWTAIRKMSTEEEAQRVDELLQSWPGFNRQNSIGQTSLGINHVLPQYPDNPILRVLWKKAAHECQTGHRIKSGKG